MIKILLGAIKTFVSTIYSLGHFLVKSTRNATRDLKRDFEWFLKYNDVKTIYSFAFAKALLSFFIFLTVPPIKAVLSLPVHLFKKFISAALLPLAIKFRSPRAVKFLVNMGADLKGWLYKAHNKENIRFILETNLKATYSYSSHRSSEWWIDPIIQTIQENRIDVIDVLLAINDNHYNTHLFDDNAQDISYAIKDFADNHRGQENYEVLDAIIQNDMFFNSTIKQPMIFDDRYFHKFFVKKINNFFTRTRPIENIEHLEQDHAILLALLTIKADQVADHQAKVQHILEPLNRISHAASEFDSMLLKPIKLRILRRAIQFNHSSVIQTMLNYAESLEHVLDHHQETWNGNIQNSKLVQNFIDDYFINFQQPRTDLELATLSARERELMPVIFKALIQFIEHENNRVHALQLLTIKHHFIQAKCLDILLLGINEHSACYGLAQNFIDVYFTSFEGRRIDLHSATPSEGSLKLAAVVLEALIILPANEINTARALQLLDITHVTQAIANRIRWLTYNAILSENTAIATRLSALRNVLVLARQAQPGLYLATTTRPNRVLNFRDDCASESAILALTDEENAILKRVEEKYTPQVNELGGPNAVIEKIQAYLAKRYQANPETIQVNGKIISLPLLWQDVVKLRKTLHRQNYELDLKAYYVNKAHTAYRFFLKPNPMIAPGACYVTWNGDNAHAIYDDHIPLIALIWLACSDNNEIVDPNIPKEEQITTEMRIYNFIDTFAHFNRAHNVDTDSTKDDLLGDNPSCFSGMRRRIFESCIGHSLYQTEKKYASPLQLHYKLNALIKDYYRNFFATHSSTDLIALKEKISNAMIDFDPIESPKQIMEMVPDIEKDKQQDILAQLAKEFEITTERFPPVITNYFNMPNGHFFSLYTTLDLKSLLTTHINANAPRNLASSSATHKARPSFNA